MLAFAKHCHWPVYVCSRRPGSRARAGKAAARPIGARRATGGEWAGHIPPPRLAMTVSQFEMGARLLLALLALACLARGEGVRPALRFPGPGEPLKLLQLTDLHLGEGETKDGPTLEVSGGAGRARLRPSSKAPAALCVQSKASSRRSLADLGHPANRICAHSTHRRTPPAAAPPHAARSPTPTHPQFVRSALAAEQPDAVLFTGDMVSGFAFSAHDLAARLRRRLDASLATGSWFEQQWQRLTEPLREAGVPWAAALGNHDAEVGGWARRSAGMGWARARRAVARLACPSRRAGPPSHSPPAVASTRAGRPGPARNRGAGRRHWRRAVADPGGPRAPAWGNQLLG